jgi:hypothetical protein
MGRFAGKKGGGSGRYPSLVQRDQEILVTVRAIHLGEEDHGSGPVMYALPFAVWTLDQVSIEIKLNQIGFHDADDNPRASPLSVRLGTVESARVHLVTIRFRSANLRPASPLFRSTHRMRLPVLAGS